MSTPSRSHRLRHSVPLPLPLLLLLLLLLLQLPAAVCVRHNHRQHSAGAALQPEGGGKVPANAPGTVGGDDDLSQKVLVLERLSTEAARRPQTKAACLAFADALGIGKRGADTANETRALEFTRAPGGVFPVRDAEHRISCAFGIGTGTGAPGASAFVELAEEGHGQHRARRRGLSRWLGNDTMRSEPEPLRNTMGVGVLETNIFQDPESPPSIGKAGSAGDALKAVGSTLATAAMEQGKWMMDNTAAAKESCVGCLFVWRKIHSAVDQSAGPDTISKMFEQTCAYMPPCFFDACDAMFSQQEAMVQDYLADVSFWDMCIYSGLCWTGLGVL